jgi:hypothetical protein
MSRPASVIVVTILVACGAVDYLNRNVNGPPTPPALFYGIVLCLMVWGIDSVVRKLLRRRSARAEEQA